MTRRPSRNRLGGPPGSAGVKQHHLAQHPVDGKHHPGRVVRWTALCPAPTASSTANGPGHGSRLQQRPTHATRRIARSTRGQGAFSRSRALADATAIKCVDVGGVRRDGRGANGPPCTDQWRHIQILGLRKRGAGAGASAGESIPAKPRLRTKQVRPGAGLARLMRPRNGPELPALTRPKV